MHLIKVIFLQFQFIDNAPSDKALSGISCMPFSFFFILKTSKVDFCHIVNCCHNAVCNHFSEKQQRTAALLVIPCQLESKRK